MVVKLEISMCLCRITRSERDWSRSSKERESCSSRSSSESEPVGENGHFSSRNVRASPTPDPLVLRTLFPVPHTSCAFTFTLFKKSIIVHKGLVSDREAELLLNTVLEYKIRLDDMAEKHMTYAFHISRYW